MSGRVAFVWDDQLRRYDFGSGHPLAPVRVQLAYRMIRDSGLMSLPTVELVSPVVSATPADLLRVHTPAYIAAVERASAPYADGDLAYGLGTDDVPVFPGMHDAAAAVCGASITAARKVFTGEAAHGINLTGGLHHAMPGAASGFCVYNDAAVAIAWLLAQGIDRIGYVDVDVHHGDGVQAAFYDDPRVMTISLHEDPRTLFPGTGFPDESGGPRARGTAVNVALPAGTGDDQWLRAFDAIVPEVLRAFRPQVLVTQQGCDSHVDDPLAHLALTVDGQRASYRRLHGLAHELCGGQWVALGGGGYEWIDVVPRAWTHLVAEAAGAPIDPTAPVPGAFTAFVRDHLGRAGPARMGDGRQPSPAPWPYGFDPAEPIDRAIMRTREEVFGLLGLPDDPYVS